jgi:hypothetical protein
LALVLGILCAGACVDGRLSADMVNVILNDHAVVTVRPRDAIALLYPLL